MIETLAHRTDPTAGSDAALDVPPLAVSLLRDGFIVSQGDARVARQVAVIVAGIRARQADADGGFEADGPTLRD